jgi:dihydrodipicolinate synthase/N-acetylneuraminate lyase
MSKIFNFLENSRGTLMVPLATWFDDNDEVNTDAMCKHVERLMKGGLDGGVFVGGSSGEGPYLTSNDKSVIYQAMASFLNGRLPLMAGISALSVREAIHAGKNAINDGCDALLAIVPEYFALQSSDVDLYFRKLAEGFQGDDVPILMYYFPKVFGYRIDPETVFNLAKDKVICGIKCTAVDLDFVSSLRTMIQEDRSVQCSVIAGNDALLVDCLKNDVQIDAALMGSINLFPGFYKALLKAFTEEPRNDARCSALEKNVEVIQKLFTMELRELPALIKESLCAAKLPFARDPRVASPLPSLGDDMKRNMIECLKLLKTRGIEP